MGYISASPLPLYEGMT